MVSFDDNRANYALLQSGWDGDSYLHGAVVHIRIIDGKIWIHCDGTEEGVATELLEMGVPKSQIVLGFRQLQPVSGSMQGWRWLNALPSSCFF